MASLDDESEPRQKIPSQKFVSHENRHFTDPVGAFIYSFIAFFTCLGLLIKYSNYQEDTDFCPHSTPARESWNNSQNVSNNVIYNTSELADSINYMLKTEQLISGISVWQLGYIARSLFGLYIFKQIVNLLSKIPYEAVSLAEFYVHILIINVVRPTVTLIFFVVLHFQSTESWISFEHENYGLLCIEPFILPLMFGFILSGFYIYVETSKKQSIISNIKSTIRFYIKIRYLLLFRFLILTVMELFVICLIITSENVQSCHFLADKGIIIITFLLLFSFHTYGEMIIMTAAAEHNWDQNEEEVSFKTLLNAIVIVTKNHLGSIFLDTLLKITSVLNIPIERFYGYESSIGDHVGHLTYSKAYTRKLSRMFTAALGQSHFHENMKSIEYFREQGRPLLVPENKSNVAFIVILKWSAIWTFICYFWEEGSASTLTIMMIIFLNLSVMSVVFYMTTAMDTIDNMIQFGKIQDDERYEEEESNRNSWEEHDHSGHDL